MLPGPEARDGVPTSPRARRTALLAAVVVLLAAVLAWWRAFAGGGRDAVRNAQPAPPAQASPAAPTAVP
jgi:predicted small secreted protein